MEVLQLAQAIGMMELELVLIQYKVSGRQAVQVVILLVFTTRNKV